MVDIHFLMGFSAADIHTITYFATCDRYEAILKEEKLKKVYELIHSRSKNGEKTIQLRHKITNEISTFLRDFANLNLIDSITSADAYHLGYLAGQEQTWKDYVRLKLISNNNQEKSNNDIFV